MPPSSRALRFLGYALSSRPYVCPSCARSSRSIAGEAPDSSVDHWRPSTRRASTVASNTAINATKDIPTEFLGLHTALERLRKDASTYVDLSRLRLALQGLESRRPVIRIAILGIHGPASARNLARLLLADPLEPEQPWETRLSSSQDDDGRSLLLRYGSEDDAVPSSPILRTIHIPSDRMRKYNIEFLIASIPNASEALPTSGNLDDLALVPMVGTPRSFTGSMSFVRYPVHQALLLAEGLKGCLDLASWEKHVSSQTGNNNVPIKLLLDLSFPGEQGRAQEKLSIELIDTSKASLALELLRQSTENGAAFGKGWLQSRIAPVSNWLFASSQPINDSIMTPAVRNLIDDAFDRTTQSVAQDKSRRAAILAKLSPSTEQLRVLDDAVKRWAALSHTELRDGLAVAFTSREFVKLRWWKLFWRVDDVFMILTQIVEQRWLVEAEKGELWLFGRATEAGLSFRGNDHTKVPAERESTNALASLFSAGQVESQRKILKLTTVSPLQALAQSLVLQTILSSTTAAGISALFYVTWPALGLYGAGSITALGLVWSLRRLQKHWGSAMADWRGALHEQGRLALKQTQDRMQQLIAQGPVQQLDNLDTLQDLETAEVLLENARAALAEVRGVQQHVGL